MKSSTAFDTLFQFGIEFWTFDLEELQLFFTCNLSAKYHNNTCCKMRLRIDFCNLHFFDFVDWACHSLLTEVSTFYLFGMATTSPLHPNQRFSSLWHRRGPRHEKKFVAKKPKVFQRFWKETISYPYFCVTLNNSTWYDNDQNFQVN